MLIVISHRGVRVLAYFSKPLTASSPVPNIHCENVSNVWPPMQVDGQLGCQQPTRHNTCGFSLVKVLTYV